MIRNLKALGLALVAVFAFSALAASSASAEDTFTSGTASAFVTAHATTLNKFVIRSPVLAVECTTAHFEGTFANGAKTATVKPTYTGIVNETPHTNTKCTSTGGSSTVRMNGCRYVLSGNTSGKDGAETDATVWIECNTSTEEIEVETNLGATIEIPTQTPTEGGVSYKNTTVGGFGVVDIKATATGITYTCTPAFVCGLGGISTEANNSDYTGEVLAEGFEDNGGVKGKQTNISVTTS